MPRFTTGVIVSVLDSRPGIIRCLVKVDGDERLATVFSEITGPVEPGDRVVLNTTAVDLSLGTGGQDFVLWNLSRDEAGDLSSGHIMKLRYTPWQLDVPSAEAPESPHHDRLREVTSLNGMPVIVCPLHSQVAAAAAVIRRSDDTLRVAYLMTDGGALPIAHSDLIASLKGKGLIDVTVTAGHAFGGDLETVNVFSGLIAAREVGNANITIVSPGPGVVGTDSIFGHSGMEQGQVLNAAGALGGTPIAALRISFADARERHRIVSHHSLAALRYSAMVRAIVAVPSVEAPKADQIMSKLEALEDRHEIRTVDASGTLPSLEAFGLNVTTMRRKLTEDPQMFEAAGAAALIALECLESDDSKS